MSHQVVWTKRVVQLFEDYGNLTDFQKSVLQTRISGMTIRQQSFYLSCSESVISRTIADLKRIYDVVQKEHPNDLKPRKSSAAQLYMDEH